MKASEARICPCIKAEDSEDSDRAELLRQTSLIIWDEVAMQYCLVIEVADRNLQDNLNKPNLPFGGITVAWEGGLSADLACGY